VAKETQVSPSRISKIQRAIESKKIFQSLQQLINKCKVKNSPLGPLSTIPFASCCKRSFPSNGDSFQDPSESRNTSVHRFATGIRLRRIHQPSFATRKPVSNAVFVYTSAVVLHRLEISCGEFPIVATHDVEADALIFSKRVKPAR